MGLRLSVLRTLSSLCGFSSLSSGEALDISQETVVVISDKIRAARLAVLLKLGTHELKSLLLILSHLWVVEEHAVLIADKLLEKVLDVTLGFKARVLLTVDSESTAQVGLRLVGALKKLGIQVFHLLLQNLVVSLEDNRVLGQDLF